MNFETYLNAINTRRTTTIVNGLEWDGRAEWQPMKNSLSPDADGAQWSVKIQSPERVAFYEKAMQLQELDDNGVTIEEHHFLMQCARIPILDTASPRKIMQVALNAAQLLSEIEIRGKESFSTEVRELYEEFLRLKMFTYDAYM